MKTEQLWRTHRGLLLALALVGSQADGSNTFVNEVDLSRPYLRLQRPSYDNYAINHYENYLNHTFPYRDIPKARVDPLGNHLITGYDLYRWDEVRTDGLKYGSSIFKQSGGTSLTWINVFDYVVAGKDGYGDWGYHLIVGDALQARFTPLTLSKVNFNGMRFDLATTYLKFTGVASRQERPNDAVSSRYITAPFQPQIHYADDSTLLLGTRAQADIGAFQLGLNWVNQHVYQSTRSTGNSLKGRLKPDQPMMDWIIVRFRDDSPDDGVGGAAVQDLQLVINDQARPDLVPQVISHMGEPPIQVGFVSAVTGAFTPLGYDLFTASSAATPYFNEFYYRNRDFPRFADYLARLAHAAGIDVRKQANISGLEALYSLESPQGMLQADGEKQIAFLFDVSQEPDVQSVAVEALLANDYLVDVAMLYTKSTTAAFYSDRFSGTYYQTVRRSKGNVRDLSNLRRVRFNVGENTGNFTYSADANLTLAGLEFSGEYARSSVYSRYPARIDGEAAFDKAPRFSDRGAAYFLNAIRRFGHGLIGAEMFSINPGFQTEMRSFLHNESSLWLSHLDGLLNGTMYWQTVDDNDDGDRYPDIKYGNAPGVPRDRVGTDLDGVFVNQDIDNDGAPDTNRNLNRLPDYEEPFLMFDVEPNSYVYGLDRNNNDEPDQREDDAEVDYPYEYDERGYHLFGQWNLTTHWSVAAGRYDIKEIAGHGHNRSTYGQASYRRQGEGKLRSLHFESDVRRVQDDIADEIMVFDDDAGPRDVQFGGRGIAYSRPVLQGFGLPVHMVVEIRPDQLFYRDSIVSDTYVRGRVLPWSSLELVQKLRRRFNWQQGGKRHGLFQRQRRVDFWTSVSRIQYVWRWGKLTVTPQYKLLLSRLMDRERDVRLQSELRSIPILRVEYPLLSRTNLRIGFQGMGPIPYRRRDDTSKRNSFEQRTAFASITNSSRYFGYELMTIMGFNADRTEYDSPFLDDRDIHSRTFFVRVLVGFTEFGRPI